MTEKRLTLSATDKKVSGVCGGIAEYLGIDPTIVRLAVVVLFIMSFGTMLIAYIVAVAIMPNGQPPMSGPTVNGQPLP